ncbi:hypothetical protein [Romboutsia timonensis]
MRLMIILKVVLMKRFIHTLGVVSVAKKLAVLNGVSEEKAELAQHFVMI